MEHSIEHEINIVNITKVKESYPAKKSFVDETPQQSSFLEARREIELSDRTRAQAESLQVSLDRTGDQPLLQDTSGGTDNLKDTGSGSLVARMGSALA